MFFAAKNAMKEFFRTGTEVKSEKYRPLYSAEMRSRKDIIRFAECIGFRHPAKIARLQAAKYEVAPSSSGQRIPVQ